MAELILPLDSPLYQSFQEIVARRRMAFLAGLPGTGKSLLIQQLALVAQQAGRTVHLLQWDMTRAAFETAVNLAKYPEIDAVTHAVIRKAVGLWARARVWQWQQHYAHKAHFLLGEVPLIGNRLIELTQPHADEAEPFLASEQALFVVPVPSKPVRQVIESTRETTFTQPQHAKEAKDAPPSVMQALWLDVAWLGHRLGFTAAEPTADLAYDPAVYTAVYRYLLQHRQHQILPIDTVLRPQGSAYDLDISGTELTALPAEVTQIMNYIEQTYTLESAAHAVEHWYKV